MNTETETNEEFANMLFFPRTMPWDTPGIVLKSGIGSTANRFA